MDNASVGAQHAAPLPTDRASPAPPAIADFACQISSGFSSPRRLSLVRIHNHQLLHSRIQLHAQPVSQPVHEVKQTSDQHDVHYLGFTEAALLEKLEIFSLG